MSEEKIAGESINNERDRKDRFNKKKRENLQKMKGEDPEAYIKFREKRREISRRYTDKNREEINKRRKNVVDRKRNDPDGWSSYREKRREISLKSYRKNAVSTVIKARKAYAKRKGIPFELDVEWYNTEWEKGCCMTGRSFDEHGSDTSLVAHIDKKIPSLGYTKENCRLVCASYNLAKKHWTDKDVLDMAEALIKHINNNKNIG